MTENFARLPLERSEKEYIAIRLYGELGPQFYAQGRRNYRISYPRRVWLDAIIVDIKRMIRGRDNQD